MKRRLSFVVISMIILCTGCAALKHPGTPEQSFDEDQDIAALEQHFGQASAITKYYAGPQTPTARNEFITGRLTLINLQYIKFIRTFSASKAQLDSALDLLMTGVGLATTVSGGAAVKAVLGAASAGLSATRTSIDKNFFYEKTVPALVTAMNAQRKTALIPILEGITRDVEAYPMALALSDLAEYYFSGTFMGALQAIQKDAGVKEGTADKLIIEIARRPDAAKLLASLDGRMKVGKLQERIDALSNEQALALAHNPPVEDENLERLLLAQDSTKLWLTKPWAAKAALKFRVTLMRDPVADLPKWEKALP